MAIREILKVGHPTLARKAEPIASVDEDIIRLAEDMVATVHAAPGVGLAAPQVGVSKRLIVVDLSIGERPEELMVLVNPEIVREEGKVICEEGCLSVPDIQEKVTRPARVTVKGKDLADREKVIEAEDLLARVFCHEIDHLNGKLFIDKLSPLKRSLVKKKLRRAAEIEDGV
ncbi:MAG: peptide deformylase [Candidatus Aminicenantes bacterium]|nr:peptide deformylase [Candidatus Aminicenantes bacterium]